MRRARSRWSKTISKPNSASGRQDSLSDTRRPNILIVMVDQLNGTLFPDGPADFLHAPHLKALAARSARFAQQLHRLAALRAGPRLLHERPVAVAHPRL